MLYLPASMKDALGNWQGTPCGDPLEAVNSGAAAMPLLYTKGKVDLAFTAKMWVIRGMYLASESATTGTQDMLFSQDAFTWNTVRQAGVSLPGKYERLALDQPELNSAAALYSKVRQDHPVAKGEEAPKILDDDDDLPEPSEFEDVDSQAAEPEVGSAQEDHSEQEGAASVGDADGICTPIAHGSSSSSGSSSEEEVPQQEEDLDDAEDDMSHFESIKWFKQPHVSKAHVWEVSVSEKGENGRFGAFIPICSRNDTPFKQFHELDDVGLHKLSSLRLTLCGKCKPRLPEKIRKLLEDP